MDDEITPAEVRELLEGGEDVRIVDIRDEESFARGRIPGSENLPFDRLPSRVTELDGADRIVTVCPHGIASVQAARLIASFEGFDGRVESLNPGLDGWPYAIETDSERAAPNEGPEPPF